MPGNRKITSKTIKGKDGIHPGSRKAGQLDRVRLRSNKLIKASRNRRDNLSVKLQRPLFFLHSVSSPHPLTIPSLQALVELYICRNDTRLQELEQERRAGRPKSTEQLDLEEHKRKDTREWESGFEVPDLTDPRAARLVSGWMENDLDITQSHLDLLPYVRAVKGKDDAVVPAKKGRLATMGLDGEMEKGEGDDWTAIKADGEQAMAVETA